MILKGLYGGYRVRWREHGVLRQSTFRTWNDARIFDGTPLSPNSLRLVRATLSVMLGDAVLDRIIPTNPVVGIARKGRKRRIGTLSHADRQRSIRPMSYEQLAVFLETAQRYSPRRDAVLFLTLAETGLRPGEALALQWPDIDTVGRTLHIERAVSDGEIGPTKTDESRDVDLTTRVAEALAGWQASVEADALVRGKVPSAYVFTSRTGQPLEAASVARDFQALLRRAGLPRFRLYDLRHTYATQLLAGLPGVAEPAPITYVAAQLGHQKPSTTLAFYAHWLPRGDKT